VVCFVRTNIGVSFFYETRCKLTLIPGVVGRLLWFDKSTRLFGDVAKSDFHGNCVLQLTHVIYRSETANHSSAMIDQPPAANQSSAVIFSAGTDGRICVWDISDIVTSFCQRYCRRCRCIDSESENEDSSTLNSVADDSKCFTSLTETVCTEVAGQLCADDLQKNIATDRLATFNSAAGNAGSLGATEATERLAAFHTVVNSEQTGAHGRQVPFHSSFGVAAVLEESKASERRAVFHGSSHHAVSSEVTKASERQERQLEPCCVITAHQSGINSLAVCLRLSGTLCFCVMLLNCSPSVSDIVIDTDCNGNGNDH